MDIALLKTFLEVAASGSFVAAAEKLFVTQSAVSLRIQRLEESLGETLFERSRAGAILTPPGEKFERYAQSLIRIWEEARQQVAIPEGYDESLTIGAQYSLWPRLGFRWVDRLRQGRPGLALRLDLGMPERLTRHLIEGAVQIALLYTPQLRPGLEAEQVLHDELVLAASFPGATVGSLDGDYVMADWGPEFVQAHAIELPQLRKTGLMAALGALTADFIVNRRAAAYLPARYVKRYIDEGRLHLVANAPRFPYPIWAIWRDDIDGELLDYARKCLHQTGTALRKETDHVLKNLAALSDDRNVETLGNTNE